MGENFTLALFEDGNVWGWGGILHKKSGPQLEPAPISKLDKYIVTKIDCGIYHSVALIQEGILFSWGGGGKHYNRG